MKVTRSVIPSVQSVPDGFRQVEHCPFATHIYIYVYIQTLARRSQQILRMRLHISPSQLQRPVIRSCGSSIYAQLYQKENTQAQPPQMSNVHVRMHENAAVFSDQRQRLATGTSAVRLLRCALREYKLGSPAVLFNRIMPGSF